VRGPCAPLARRLMLLFAASLLEVGIVHGDPHPGNIGVLRDGRLVLYDWGASVDVTRIRGSLGKLVGCLAAKDLEGFVDALQAIGVIDASRGSDAHRVVRILEKLLLVPPEDFHVSLSQQPEFSDSSGRRLIRFGTDTVYLLRALSMIEGTCRTLDPDFSYETYWREDIGRLFERTAAARAAPAASVRTWLHAAASSPDIQRKTLGVLQQTNIELRDELMQTRRLIRRLSGLALALAALAHALA
jgi:predicted unusual protein kinase regulating ubiquinone biosynthesis (AarF/ABC1/UbiB family)